MEEITFRRIYAIPDIHGRNDLLQLLLKRLDEDGYDQNTDLMVFLGDMIDRGPDSCGVVETVKRIKESRPYVEVLKGNHEDMALAYHIRHDFNSWSLWATNGGDRTLASYENNDGQSGPGHEMAEEHVRFLAFCPYFLVTQGFFFSHAPVPKGDHKRSKNVGEYTKDEMIWSFESHMYYRHHEGPMDEDGDKCIGICGHIHSGPHGLEPCIFENYRLLDTGCGCFPNHPLIAHECISGRTIFALAKDLKKNG